LAGFRTSRELSAGELSADQFDTTFGTETGGAVEVLQMDIDGANAVYAVCYQPSPRGLFDDIVKSLPIRREQFTFVDLGCGKGLVLLLAAEFGFKAVIGVEMARDLHRKAEENVRQYQLLTKERRNITVLCLDAAEFEFPRDPLVVYLYNPFSEPVMATVVAHLEASLRDQRREIFVIYVAPACEELFRASPFFENVGSFPGAALYCSKV
jgi:SAM-dependent methyltransferase